MKVLTVNFVTCAVKACKASPLAFPLHFSDAELEQREIVYNPAFLINVLPRIDWEALRATAAEVQDLPRFDTVPATKPEGEDAQDGTVMRGLHTLLMETEVIEGKMVCGHCGHEYKIKEGIANFLLPNHLV
ncbi:hypothetical protein MMC12_007209 [Toensbergia leucococca]|nr:hypothetical protein [Toensbergia leucococca]